MALTYAPNESDRRQGLRVPQTRGVKIFNPRANRYFPAQTLDLSSTGLRLALPASTPVAAGAVLQIHVAANGMSSLAAKHSMTSARVVWMDRTAEGLQIGLQYVAASAAAASSAA